MRTTWFLILVLTALALPLWAAEPEVDARQVQSAVSGGLRWLAAAQGREGEQAGAWPAARYGTAVASLAGLAFLANGYTPGEGDYGAVLDRAMAYVQASMTPDGFLGAREQSMYVHAICTLYGLSYLGRAAAPERERELAEWGRKSVGLIVRAQQARKNAGERGGWRYTPYTEESDLSVTSWQLLALHAARQCGYEIPDEVFAAGLAYVNQAFAPTRDGQAGFLYRAGISKDPEPGVSGVAVLVKGLLEPVPDERQGKALAYLRAYPPAWGGPQYNGYFFFGAFYISQGVFQAGEEAWGDYAPKLRRVLVSHQAGDGHWDFPPDNKAQGREAGPAYATAMGVLILSLDQQFLPMYQRQKRLF